MKKRENKIVVILGATAAGKTKLAVRLANKFNGEIVSADSRQVYKGMDVGTGKDLDEYEIKSKKCGRKTKTIRIPYHLIDVVSPKTEFNLARYQKLAYKAIGDILARGKLPIIVGGTGLYIQAIVDGYELSSVKPDKKLRERLEKKTADELLAILKKFNPEKAKNLNQSERKNKRRLIRYVEIAKRQKSYPPSFKNKKYKALIIGLALPMEALENNIRGRLKKRLEKEDMTGEIKRLRERGISWKRLLGLGLEYKYVSLYLRGKLTYDEMVEKLYVAIRRFAKRQMTWFKRDKRIKWIKNRQEAQEAEKLIKEFLK